MAGGGKGKSGRGGKRKGFSLFKSGRKAVKEQIRNVNEVRERVNDGIETLALWVGVIGFLGVGVFVIWWGLLTWKPEWAPVPVETFSMRAVTLSLVASLMCASALGWLLVNDGQGAVEKKSGRILSVVLFGLLPLGCLVATLFPMTTAKVLGLPALEVNPGHTFWMWVRFYPMVLVFVCLMVAFKRTAQPRKYVKKARALKFLLLSAPYLVVMLVQEVTLVKEAAMQDALQTELLQSTLGTAGVNAQLILAVVTTSRID